MDLTLACPQLCLEPKTYTYELYFFESLFVEESVVDHTKRHSQYVHSNLLFTINILLIVEIRYESNH